MLYFTIFPSGLAKFARHQPPLETRLDLQERK
jgi:hypothetical protein